MTDSSWPQHYSTEKLLAFVRQLRVVGVLERKWSFTLNDQKQKVLLQVNGPMYLFRGQTERYTPCLPSMYRHMKSPARFLWELPEANLVKVVAEAARTFWYYSELDRHPIFRWAKSNGLYLPELELAQHYGIPTALLDMTEAIEVALFFATHRLEGGKFLPCTSGRGVLYVVDRTKVPKEHILRFTSVASQPFLRPFRQWAWTCELFMGECFEACPSLSAIQFDHSEALANEVRAMAEEAGELFPSDPLADIADRINASTTLPIDSVIAACKHFGLEEPDSNHTVLCNALCQAGYTLEQEAPTVVTDDLSALIEASHEAAIENWVEIIMAGMHQLYVRGGRGTGSPLQYGTLKPPAHKDEKRAIVPLDHYGYLLDR